MYTGGDGYTAFQDGTDVLQPGDALLDVTIEWITAHSPVAPAVEQRTGATPVIRYFGLQMLLDNEAGTVTEWSKSGERLLRQMS